jgi:hypothetical protein
MPPSDDERIALETLAEGVVEAAAGFESKLHRKGPFPSQEFTEFFRAVSRYAEATVGEPMLHRTVVAVVCGLREKLELEISRAPGRAIADADRMEVMLVRGYDPYFEGDEPPDP